MAVAPSPASVGEAVTIAVTGAEDASIKVTGPTTTFWIGSHFTGDKVETFAFWTPGAYLFELVGHIGHHKAAAEASATLVVGG